MKYLLFISIALLLFSCQKENEEPVVPDAGYDYYPLQSGITNYYLVTEITIDSIAGVWDTLQYYLKTVNDTPHADLNNQTVTPVQRYIRGISDSVWTIHDVWYAYRSGSHLVASEENVKYLKMVFPVKENKSWNGNVYNTGQEQEYTIVKADEPFTVSGINFSNGVLVEEQNDTSLIHKYYRTAWYAKGSGLAELIDVQITNARIIPVFPTPPIESRIIKGTIYRQVRVNPL